MSVIAPTWRAGLTLERLNTIAQRTLVEHLAIKVTAFDEQGLHGTMPVEARHCQPMRILHGGASVAFAETLASVGANAILEEGFAAVGQEINANHLRSVPEGASVSGIARLLHSGSRSQVWSVEIRNAAGQLTCISRVTMAVITRR